MQISLDVSQSNFCERRQRGLFYIDKTAFIKEWWGSENLVTLITRHRRFGKTLMI